MKIVSGVLGLSVTALTLSACGMLGSSSYQTYCLEEKEKNGYDYMVVAEDKVCDMGMDDVEWYDGPIGLSVGDLAYVERDNVHSARNRTSQNTIKPATSYPAYTPATRSPAPLVPQPTKICLKANAKPAPPAPKPAPPAPKPPAPAPAPVAPKPQPAPITPKPVPVAPAPTIKPGC